MATDKREYKILVVEDNPGDFALVEDFLFEHIVEPQIVQALTFKGAKQLLLDSTFDVILLDLSLPDRTGQELILDIIEISNNAPVIVLTGYVDFEFGVKSLSLGVSDYILKDELTSMSLYKSIIYSMERKKSVADLEQSEKRYSELFNFSPLPMWVVDLETLRFLDVNFATVKQYGYSHEEFLSMTLKDIRPPEEIPMPEYDPELHGFFPSAERSQDVQIHKLKNGDLRSVEIEVAAILYRGKKAQIVIATDITESLEYTKAIEDQNDRLKEISWIQSHLVRAPLARIMGLIPLLSQTNATSDDRDQVMHFILNSANELDDIIKNITEKSRIEDFANIRRHLDKTG